jgi:hypothetical protein
MLERLPIDLIIEIGINAGPDEYEELAKTSKRNAIILQKPYIVRATSELIVKVTYSCLDAFLYQNNYHSFNDMPGTIWHDAHPDLPPMIFNNGKKVWYYPVKLQTAHLNRTLLDILR